MPSLRTGSGLLRQADDLLLRTRRDNRIAPSLPKHYPVSSLLWTTPTSDAPAHTVMSSRTASGLRPPARRISQVPAQSVAARHPLSPRQAAPVLSLIASRCVPASASLAAWPPAPCVSRPFSVQPLRLTPHRFAVHVSRRFAQVLPSTGTRLNRSRSPRLVTST